MPELQGLRVDGVSIVDRAAVRDPQNKSEPRRFIVWKREGGNPEKGVGEMPQTPEEMQAAVKKAQDEAAAAVEAQKKAEGDLVKAQQERDAALAKGKEAEGKDGDGDEDDLKKSELPEAVRKRLEKAEQRAEQLEKDAKERVEKAEKAADEALKLAKAEQDRRLSAEFVAKAESEFGHLTTSAHDLGPILKSASEKLSKEEYDKLESMLKAADAQVNTAGLFKEMGAGGEPQRSGSDALSKAEAKAQDLMKGDTSLSKDAAMMKAMEGDRELQAQYLAEQRGV